ncbi:TPA: phosphopyruvate hydratase [bacterium]|nr:phosphopyruvate hydratase [bacterium]
MIEIADVIGREVLDSRGNPTVECEIFLSDGTQGSAIVPSGASTGKYEAIELRDGGERFKGKGVNVAVSNINTVIKDTIIGMDPLSQREIDNCLIKLDGTKNKSNLGANAILACSLAVVRASANFLGIPLYRYIGGVNSHILPVPLLNIINGGRHANNRLDIQEFIIIPKKANSFKEALEKAVCIYHTLKKILDKKGFSTSVGDEGGFTPDLSSAREALSLTVTSIEEAGYKVGDEISLGLDIAASELYEDGIYKIDGQKFSQLQLVEYYEELIKEFPIISIEDGMAEDDWDGWALMKERLKIQIVGDDIFVTNPDRLKMGLKKNVANAILIKLNQIGTLTETLDVIDMAKKGGYNIIISHRSGETEDSFIADFSVAVGSGQIKTGAPTRTDRCCKYNQLLRIEEDLGEFGVYGG